MADKPSRALVLYGDGLARFISPTHTHLHSFASRASCGFMALPHSPPSEKEDARIIREFAEILDANEAFENLDKKTLSGDKSQAKCVIPSLAERFMGMKVAIITDNLSLKSFGDMLGLKVLQWNELHDKSPSELLKLLGFQEGKILETGYFDFVFIHVEAGKNTDVLEGIELLDNLVGGDDDLEFLISSNKSKYDGEFSSLFPRQSYMVKAGKPRENVRQHCPMLLAQYQSAVTRVDMVKSFSFRDFTENGVNLVIPADRFLHEVAFKLWKAPKYGA